MDYAFWFGYLVPLTIGLVSGWYLRGVKAQDDDDELRMSRMNHPAFRQRWEWDD